MLSKYFSKEPVNTGRQFELDWFRFILIYRFAVIHVFVDATPPENLDVLGIPYYFDSVVGGVIGATRFMILMGIGLSYSRHATAGELFRRGVRIGITGAVLNVFRYLVPSLIGYGISGDAGKYLDELPYLFFGNDILQFAALAMMFMALLLKLKLNPPKIFAVSLAMSVAGTALRNVDLHNNVGLYSTPSATFSAFTTGASKTRISFISPSLPSASSFPSRSAYGRLRAVSE